MNIPDPITPPTTIAMVVERERLRFNMVVGTLIKVVCFWFIHSLSIMKIR
jgi:hypothetical protein